MDETNPSTAVDRALSILEALADSAEGLNNSQISRRLEIPKSSASYLLRTLERRGYVVREPERGVYRPGLRILNLNRSVLSGVSIREIALPVLRWLVDRVKLTTHLAVLDQGEAVYVERVEAPGFVRMNTWVGRRMEVHSTSVGKALAAYLKKEEVESILRQHGMRKITPKTITVPSRFLRELEKVREQGYALDDEENSIGARCVGAPVLNGRGELQAAVGVSGTTAQVNESTIPRISALVREAAARISKQVGDGSRVSPDTPLDTPLS